MKEDIHSVDVAMGRLIRVERKMRNVSQTVLGDRVGVTFQQIQKYENGTNRVSCSMLWEIAKALEMLPTYFFEKIEAEQPTNQKDAALDETFNVLHTKEGRDTADAMPKMSSKVRKAFAGLAKAVAKAELETDTDDVDETAPAVMVSAIRAVAA